MVDIKHPYIQGPPTYMLYVFILKTHLIDRQTSSTFEAAMPPREMGGLRADTNKKVPHPLQSGSSSPAHTILIIPFGKFEELVHKAALPGTYTLPSGPPVAEQIRKLLTWQRNSDLNS
jgi:hypothetical protein